MRISKNGQITKLENCKLKDEDERKF